MNTGKQLLCVACGRLHRPAAFCPVHTDEPLLDPDCDDVRFELISLDDKARSRMYTRWMIGLGALAFLASTLGYWLFKLEVSDLIEAFWAEIIFGATAGGGLLGFLVARKRFAPRFSRWTRES